MITLIFAVITFALLIKLNEIIGVHIGFKIEKEKLQDTDSDEMEIKEVSDQEKILQVVMNGCRRFDQEDFLKKAKKVFELVFRAYADGDKTTLKDLLSPRTLKAFSMAIDDRQKRGEALEGNILQIVNAELVDADVDGDNVYVTVKFLTDQTTVLKSSDGTVLEGSPDYVDSHTDIWVFTQKVNSSDPRWFLHEIKSED